jgi:hypothetical protein
MILEQTFCAEGQQEVGTTVGGKWLEVRQSIPEQRVQLHV